MCGIAGIFHGNGHPVDRSDLERMTDALRHRGPDGQGIFIQGPVGLGHRRLAILDTSHAADQPMISADGRFSIVFNGEIYNFQELREQLRTRGHHFSSNGDTAVLLAAYQEFGDSCPEHLSGMFAFAVYDARERTLFLARDRLGKKPLKYFRHGSTFVFASELKSLITHPLCPREVQWADIHDALTLMYVPGPNTGLVGIQKFPQAHSITMTMGESSWMPQRYWHLEYQPTFRGTASDAIQQTSSLFDTAVRQRMVSDVPVGAFLSGGVDSAAVVAYMTRHQSVPVRTFSIGTREQTHNELPDAERIAKLFNTEHQSIHVTPDIVTLLPELIHTYEEPYGDPSVIPTYLLCRDTRPSVSVALNGDGGDENFGGYVRYPILRLAHILGAMPRWLHSTLAHSTALAVVHWKTTLAYRSHRFALSLSKSEERRHVEYLSVFTEDEKRCCYRTHRSFRDTGSHYESLIAEHDCRGASVLQRALERDIHTYLANDLLPKVDLGSMAHGLEVRSPFLDHTLLEFTATLPDRWKIRGMTRKWLLKKMLANHLPHDHLRRPKTGFRLPLDAWFRGPLKEWCQMKLLEDSPHSYWSLFDRRGIERFMGEYHGSSIDYSDHVWQLLWTSEWLKQYGA